MEYTTMTENVPFCYIEKKSEGDKKHPHLLIAINSKYNYIVPNAVELGKVHDQIMKREFIIKRDEKKHWYESNLDIFDVPIILTNREQNIELDEIKVITKVTSAEKYESIIVLKDEDDFSVSGSADELII